MDALAEMTHKKKVLKENLDASMSMNAQVNEELLLVRSCNFDINQCLVRIIEQKDALYVD